MYGTYLFFATRKKKLGVGDIDLGIYDPRSRVLLLCEIKTVFDRFRTNYQISNFTGQRVNFDKAEKQLAVSTHAIVSGSWTLSDIFGCSAHFRPPKRILPLVLTWYDQHNPWLGGSDANPVSCNFRVFQHLFTQARGNLSLLHESIAQLSRIYCVAARRPYGLPRVDKGVAVTRDVQTDALPPEDVLRGMPLSKFVRKEIEHLAKFPRDWPEQIRAQGRSPCDYHIYEYDES